MFSMIKYSPFFWSALVLLPYLSIRELCRSGVWMRKNADRSRILKDLWKGEGGVKSGSNAKFYPPRRPVIFQSNLITHANSNQFWNKINKLYIDNFVSNKGTKTRSFKKDWLLQSLVSGPNFRILPVLEYIVDRTRTGFILCIDLKYLC